MGLIRRSYTHLDIISFRCLFSSLVKPHSEYCVSIWCPLLKEDLEEELEEHIENVLRPATKLISGLYDKPYKEHLPAIKVPSMRYCRMQGDMILVYKILLGENQSLCNLLMIIESRIRAITLNFIKHLFKLQYVYIFFSIRVINNWNSLPYEGVNGGSLNNFKSKLDNAWEDKIYVF